MSYSCTESKTNIDIINLIFSDYVQSHPLASEGGSRDLERHILIVCDDVKKCECIRQNANQNGFSITHCIRFAKEIQQTFDAIFVLDSLDSEVVKIKQRLSVSGVLYVVSRSKLSSAGKIIYKEYEGVDCSRRMSAEQMYDFLSRDFLIDTKTIPSNIIIDGTSVDDFIETNFDMEKLACVRAQGTIYTSLDCQRKIGLTEQYVIFRCFSNVDALAAFRIRQSQEGFWDKYCERDISSLRGEIGLRYSYRDAIDIAADKLLSFSSHDHNTMFSFMRGEKWAFRNEMSKFVDVLHEAAEANKIVTWKEILVALLFSARECPDLLKEFPILVAEEKLNITTTASFAIRIAEQNEKARVYGTTIVLPNEFNKYKDPSTILNNLRAFTDQIRARIVENKVQNYHHLNEIHKKVYQRFIDDVGSDWCKTALDQAWEFYCALFDGKPSITEKKVFCYVLYWRGLYLSGTRDVFIYYPHWSMQQKKAIFAISNFCRREYVKTYFDVYSQYGRWLEFMYLMYTIRSAQIKSAIGSIMSRNGSHNIGSHVLAALSHNVGTLPDDRVLYQYIQQRMDYIATVTTDFPTWTQPTMFVADMVKTFLSQRHLLDHIVESEGLKAFQFQNPNIDGEAWFDQHDCVRIHVRKIDSDRSVIEDFIKYNQDNDPIALDKDVALAIPGGIVGEHAFYTILENIIRNAAKHSWTALKQRQRGDDEVEVKYDNLHLYIDFEDKDEKVEFKVYTKLPVNRVVVKRDNNGQLYQELVCQGDLTKWKGKFNELGEIEVGAKSDFDKRPPHYQQQIKLSLDLIKREKLHEWVNKFDQPAGLSPEDQKLFDELPIHFKQQIMLARPFINSEGSLRRENWGMAEMKISAGYLAGRSVEDIGGLGEKKGTNDIIVPYIEHKKEFRCCGSDLKPIDIEENYLGYQFSIAKPKEILIVVEATDGWGTVDARNELKKVGIFVKTVDEIKAEKRLNYRYVVYYDVNTLFDENYQVKDDILLPFRVLSGAKIHDSKKRLRKFIPKIDIGEIQGFAQVLAKALAEEEVTEDAKNNAIQNAKQNIEQLVYTQYLNHIKTEQNKTRKEADEVHNIGLLVAINENEKAGGNSLISDADILELMMEQNFASCVDQYKALMPVDACKKILRPLEIIRNSNSEKCVKFKDRKGATIKQLIAQRLYDWMHQKKKYKDASGKDVSCPVISKNLEIVTHLEEKYSVSRQEEKGKKPFDDPVSALLKQHPIDDFIRYVESVFENTKTLFKQYEEKIVTLPAGYKVQASDVKDGEKFVDGIKIVTSAKETKGDSCHWIGYRRHSHTLPVDATQSLYVEPLSGTQTYLSQLSKVKSDLGLQMRLIENGLMRILVLDERVAKFLREHMAEVGNHYKAMNINVIDDKWVEADNRDVKKADGFFTGYTKDVSTVLENYANANGEQKSKLENELEKIKHKDFSEIDILIVHQGILDKWFEKLKSVEGMKHLLEGFKQLVKYVVVTTGRGTPENIPEEAHLLPFAVVESTLFKKYPEKLILTDTIMNVLPVGKKNNGG